MTLIEIPFWLLVCLLVFAVIGVAATLFVVATFATLKPGEFWGAPRPEKEPYNPFYKLDMDFTPKNTTKCKG